MTALAALLDSHPERKGDDGLVADTVAALQECAQICTACADACLAEPDVAGLADCIRHDLDCADICATTARVLIRSGNRAQNQLFVLLDACAQACRASAEECDRHAGHHEHCRICAQSCRIAEQACWELLSTAYQTPEGVPAVELPEDDLDRELAHLHRTRHDTFLHAAEPAVAHHTERMTELEAEYLRRHPDRPVEARRTRAGARAES